jgi:RNA polymerase sigma-70 factor, ECF subfamily
MMPPDDDAQLMLRFQQGDEAALETLVAAYRRRIMSVAYRFLQNRADAEDVTQDVFVRVFQAKERYHPSAKFSSWIFTIVYHLCQTRLARKKRYFMESLFAPARPGEPDSVKEWADPRSPNAEGVLEKNETCERVRLAVASLPEVERMAVILYEWENMSLEMIGQVLNKRVSAVKSILFRAREKLRRKLGPKLNPETAG